LRAKFVEKIKNTLCSLTVFFSFFFESCAVYEIMWKNMVDTDRPQMTMWRMRVACSIPKATNAHSQYVIVNAFPLQQSLHESACLVEN